MIKTHSQAPDDPFFALSNGSAVSKYLLVKFLQTKMVALYPKIDAKEWSGISLRKGGGHLSIKSGDIW